MTTYRRKIPVVGKNPGISLFITLTFTNFARVYKNVGVVKPGEKER